MSQDGQHIGLDVASSVVVEQLRAGQPVTLRLWGRSMTPTVWPGTRLTFVPCGVGEARIGDVLLVLRAGGLTAHRAVDVGAAEVRTWGDGLLEPDGRCPPEALLGRAPGLALGRAQVPLPARVAAPLNVALGAVARRITGARARIARSSARAPLLALLTATRGVRRLLQPFEVVPLDRGWRERLGELELRASRRATPEAVARWRAALEGGGAAWLAVSRRRDLVGWMLAVEEEDGAFGLQMWVSSAHRRLGVASALLERMLETATDRGWASLRVRRGSAFWRHCGFLPRSDGNGGLERSMRPPTRESVDRKPRSGRH